VLSDWWLLGIIRKLFITEAVLGKERVNIWVLVGV
jgi:hypothetical protein